MIALTCLITSSIASSNNETSESLLNPPESLNTALLRSSRNPSTTSIMTGGIKITILGLKAMTSDTAG
jgi:hypothetical protein